MKELEESEKGSTKDGNEDDAVVVDSPKKGGKK
jgi:translocation protein SEC66